jgi:hypothetical protein
MGIFERIWAKVKAVVMSPYSMRSNVPVGKNGNTRVKDETNSMKPSMQVNLSEVM